MSYGRRRKLTARELDELQLITEQLLLKLGIPMNLNGFRYLCRCCMHAVVDPMLLQRITKNVYPEVADEFDVSVGSVEIAIRRAIDAAWNDGSGNFRRQYSDLRLGQCWRKPKNTEFISVISWRLRYQLPGKADSDSILSGMIAAEHSQPYGRHTESMRS